MYSNLCDSYYQIVQTRTQVLELGPRDRIKNLQYDHHMFVTTRHHLTCS